MLHLGVKIRRSTRRLVAALSQKRLCIHTVHEGPSQDHRSLSLEPWRKKNRQCSVASKASTCSSFCWLKFRHGRSEFRNNWGVGRYIRKQSCSWVTTTTQGIDIRTHGQHTGPWELGKLKLGRLLGHGTHSRDQGQASVADRRMWREMRRLPSVVKKNLRSATAGISWHFW